MAAKLKKKITKLGLLSTRNKAETTVSNEADSGHFLHNLHRFGEGVNTAKKTAENRHFELQLRSFPFGDGNHQNEAELRQLWAEYKNILIETSNHIIAQDFERQPSAFLDVIKRQNEINERLARVLKLKEESGLDTQTAGRQRLSKSDPEIVEGEATGKLSGARSPSDFSNACDSNRIPALSSDDLHDPSKWQMFRVDETVDCFVPKSVKSTPKSPRKPTVSREPESRQSRD